jgi:hypothetical protein
LVRLRSRIGCPRCRIRSPPSRITGSTFGVVTTGVFTRRWKAEASLFNGREPDDDRWDVNIDPWDSLSGRLTLTPTASLALQVSAAHLNEAETGPEALARVDVNRVTASVTYHRRLQRPGFWATTVAWGRNEESGTKTHALLAESSVTLNQRDVWFGRFEVAGKEAHDLHVEEFGDEVFIVSKVVGGYTRYLASAAGLRLGLGGHLSAGVVPEGLKPTYGHRANLGLGFYVTVRPGAQKM